MAPAARQPQPPGRNLPALYVSPWRLLRQDLLAVLASLRLKLQELWRLNGAGELPRPGFWPRPLAAWFLPLLLGLLLALAFAVVGLGVGFITSRPEPASQGPQREFIRPTPEPYAPAGSGSWRANPRSTSPPGTSSSDPSDAGSRDGSTSGGGRPTGQAMGLVEAPQPGGQGQQQPDTLGVEPQPPPGGDALKVLAGGPEPMATASASPDWPAGWQAKPPGLEAVAPAGALLSDGLDVLPGAGNPVPPSSTGATDRPAGVVLLADPAETLLELLRAATPQAPPHAVQLADGTTTVVLRTAAGFEQASAAARQDWADRWLELVRERGFSQLTLLDPAGRLLGSQARVGSGMILLQPFREPP